MNLAVYMAYHSETYPEPLFDYVIPIQVGAHKHKQKSSAISDDTGINISHKNDIMSELTALYWIWKNSTQEYLGLCHYRRFFDLEVEPIKKILLKDYIIVPDRMILSRSIKDQYIVSHTQDEWNVMMESIREHAPHYYAAALQVFAGNVLYPFNMFICSRYFLDSYCTWLFPILASIEAKVDVSNKDKYQKRYLGFLAERLFTLYILYNGNRVKEVKIIDLHKKRVSQPAWLKGINSIRFAVRKSISHKGGQQ
jgi:hypothetical protein